MPIELDDSQARVIAELGGANAVVLGAAGSGKTATVVELVASRLAEPGWNAGDVIVLAGTRHAATRLRDRLAARFAGIAPGPLARTAASLAFAVLAAEELGEGRKRPLLMTGAEHDLRLSELLAGHIESGTGPQWPTHLGPIVRRQRGFRTELRDVMARATELGVSPAELAAQQGPDGAWSAVAACMTELDAILALEHRAERLVLDSAALLHTAALRIDAGIRAPAPRLIVVDDGQELTLGAVALLGAYARRGVRVVAFGDPDTATGMFRGSEPSLLPRLPELLPGTWQQHTLGTVWRHGGPLATTLARITGGIGAARAATQRRAEAAGPSAGAMAISVDSAADEEATIARMLRERHVLEGVPWSDMAVVTRSQRLAQRLARSLAQLEVPTESQGASQTRRETAVADLMAMLGVVTERVTLDADMAVRLLTSPLVGLDAVQLRRLRRSLRHAAIDAGDAFPAPTSQLLAEACAEPARFLVLDGAAARAAARLASSLQQARTDLAAGAEPAESVLWGLWDRAKVAAGWRAAALAGGHEAAWANRRLDAVVALFDRAARFAEQRPDATAADFYDDWTGADVDPDSLAARAAGEAVAIGTPTAFVSREFDTVVVAGVQDGAWPNLRQRGSLLGANQLVAPGAPPAEVADVLHDEQRMFAHAASRARQRLIVTAVAGEDAMPSRLFALVPPSDAPPVPIGADTSTLRGLVGALRQRLAEDASDADAASALARLAAAGVPGAAPDQWAGLAPSTSDELLTGGDGDVVRVSPSSIDRFQSCALNWAVSQLSGDSSGQAASIGTLVHAAVEHAEPTADALMAAIEERWPELGFRASWESMRELALVRGMMQRLEEYFATLAASGWRVDRDDHERRFELAVGEALLVGSIDWIERSDSGVRIVDLKTGKTALTAKELAAHSQLRAYQLALARGEIASDGAANEGARIVRPKADPKKVVEHQEPLAPEDIAAFEILVTETARGMAAAAFDAEPTKHCLGGFFAEPCRLHAVGEVTE